MHLEKLGDADIEDKVHILRQLGNEMCAHAETLCQGERLIVDENGALRRRIALRKALDIGEQTAFTAACRPYNGDDLACGNGQRDVFRITAFVLTADNGDGTDIVGLSFGVERGEKVGESFDELVCRQAEFFEFFLRDGFHGNCYRFILRKVGEVIVCEKFCRLRIFGGNGRNGLFGECRFDIVHLIGTPFVFAYPSGTSYRCAFRPCSTSRQRQVS